MTTPIFQIPPVTPQDWLILGLLALMACTALITALLPRTSALADPLHQLRTALGLSTLPRLVVLAGTLLWGTLLVVLVGSLIWTLVDIRQHLAPTADRAEALRGLLVTLTAMTATLGAVVAFPVTLTRIRQSQKANDLTDERLFNDKLNEASKNLAAWRDVTTVLGTGDDRKTITTREPDLITRAAAIDRLYSLVEERPSEANRIASLLSLYVREHSSYLSNDAPDVGGEVEPKNATPTEVQYWAQNLFPKRSDLERATQALGKHRKIFGVVLQDNVIDLTGANLQGMDLSGLNFGKSNFQSAWLQGADLSETNLQGALFAGAKLSGAHLFESDLKNTQLFRASFSGSELGFADLRGVGFREVVFDRLTDLNYANLVGASFKSINLQNSPQLSMHLSGIFGDGSNTVFPWPDHWPKEKLGPIAFIRAWRKWVAENHPDVLQYLPDEPEV